MAAGLGFKTFSTGDVLSATDVNGYLMQGILVFASAAARDAAITAPAEGQFAYLKDTNVTTYYTGSAWANVDTTGMTNPMTTTGDTIYSSSGSTPARLAIGSTGNVLTVSGGVPVWSAPAGGGKVLQVVSAVTSTQTNIATTTATDTGITLNITPTSATSKVLVMITANVSTSRNTNAAYANFRVMRGATVVWDGHSGNICFGTDATGSTAMNVVSQQAVVYLDSPATTSATTYKMQGAVFSTANSGACNFQYGNNPSTITLLEIGA